MRVLLAHTNMSGAGAANSVRLLGRMLAQKGHHVAVASPYPEGTKMDSFRLVYVSTWDFWRVVDHRRAKQRLTEVIKEFQPDIIHVNNINGLSLAPLQVAKVEGLPIIITLRDYYWLCGNSMLWRNSWFGRGKLCTKTSALDCVVCGFKSAKLSQPKSILLAFLYAVQNVRRRSMKNFLADFDRVVCISEFQKRFFDLDNSTLIYNMYDPYISQTDSDDSDFFISGGRLEKYKGFHVLLEAFRGIEERLLICGSGPYESVLQRIARGMQNVEILSFMPHDKYLREVAKAKALIIPSLWYEGCPLSILEAYSCRTPVIGSDIGAITEQISDGRTGFLCRPGDALALREAIRKMHSFEMDRNALDNLLARFNPEIIIEKYISLYRDVIEDRKNKG